MRTNLRGSALWALGLGAAALAGCDSDPEDGSELIALCAPDLTVRPIAWDSQALIVTEEVALSRLPLKDVLARVIELHGDQKTTPLDLMQQLFDTSNDEAGAVRDDAIHCDSPDNPAHANSAAPSCPRPEGALAARTGFFTPGDPDHFYPVAVVNRIDLMSPTADCGQARIIYAKTSGLTDPDDRVFLNVEAVVRLTDSTEEGLMCRKPAQFWDELGAETDPEKVADSLHRFFFDGIDGQAVLRPSNLGSTPSSSGAYYTDGRPSNNGQVRLSQHFHGEWEYREYRVGARPSSGSAFGPLTFIPATVGNNPVPALFGASTMPERFRQSFVTSSVSPLAAKSVVEMGMSAGPLDLSGESELGGPFVNDYAARAAGNEVLKGDIQTAIDQAGLSVDCPPDDPLTAESILRRATMQSCAGCHAPARFLGEERRIGCGMTWPDSLEPAHVDEHGTLSPALEEVFLPHRAEVLTGILQACSLKDVRDALARLAR